ncbi:uncharacterized protein LOC123545825 [Mercenaria mercenaria]|uniref:uncharacterized protein LOC123545825 n=1 Tax=Mercenaria mercenaria TaxID=6596 RepID=UPI00234F2592|nr:uncharacterized protein LOC123545825 [Mercenaria mercenaria]
MTDETDATRVKENLEMESKILQENDFLSSNSTQIIYVEPIGDENEVSPTLDENLEVEVEEAQEPEQKIPDDPSDTSETQQYVISDVEDIENTPSDSESSEFCDWDSPAKQGTVNSDEHSFREENNKLSASKITVRSFSPKQESLNVPAYPTLLKDDGRESAASNVRMGSKLSLLSQIPQRSAQLDFDFTAVQMPVVEKKEVPIYEDSWIRIAIPYLPLWVAVLCLVLNILISGSGTILSGFCILCCAKPRVPPKYDPDPVLLICANTWVGLAQLFTVTFLLVGWFWSIAWGIRMVILSLEHRREREELLKTQAVSAFKHSLAINKLY